MFKKNYLALLLCLIISVSFILPAYADTPILYQPQEQSQAAYIKNYADIPSGRTANGFYYGLERLASTRQLIHGVPVTITSVAKLAENQYQVTCVSEKYVANGTFIVDIFREYDAAVREGYSLWFGLFDASEKRYGTAQVKRKVN